MAKKEFTIKHGSEGEEYGDSATWTLAQAVEILTQCVTYGHKATLKYRPNKVKK